MDLMKLVRRIVAKIADRRTRRLPSEQLSDEIRTARLVALRRVMAEDLADDGWLEVDPTELEKWICADDDLADRAWLDAAKKDLLDQHVLPRHVGGTASDRIDKSWN
jgi:hypothetical protein